MFDSGRSVLNHWLEAVNRLDLEGICNLYRADAVLLPTFSSRIRTTPENRADYFRGLAQRKSVLVTLDEASYQEFDLGSGVFSVSGLYDWTFDGESTSTARYSYVFDTRSANPIVQHHSSVVPDAP